MRWRAIRAAALSVVPGMSLCVLLWCAVFVYKYYDAFQTIVKRPPNINITWTHLDAYEVMPGGPHNTDVEIMKDFQQYATEVTRLDKSPVSLSQETRFQFPYPVENTMLLHDGVEAVTLEPVIMPLALGQNASMQRDPHYSNYVLTVRNGNSSMRVRFVILLRTKPLGWLAHIGPKDVKTIPPPLLPQQSIGQSYDPLHKYIIARESMNYEGQPISSAGRYAAFYTGERGLVYLGPWSSPPPSGLQVSVDWQP